MRLIAGKYSIDTFISKMILSPLVYTTGIDSGCCPRTQLLVFANKALHGS